MLQEEEYWTRTDG